MSSGANATLTEIGDALRGASSVVLLSHTGPDGDAIGSQVALGSSLRAIGKDVVVMNENGCPESLSFLPESKGVTRPGEATLTADLCVALDTANRARLGAGCLAATASATRTINIDHHISNERYGDLVHVDAESPATGQIVFELIRANDFPLTEAARDNLFVAISTDTGSFRYPATTARTYEVIAELVRAGADVGALSQAVYERYPFRRVELLRELLGNLQLTAGDRVASWSLDLETKGRLSLEPDDSENLTDIIRSIDTVVVAVFFEELRPVHGIGTIRVSMRSKDSDAANVCEICRAFGGGGHALAAGARVEGRLDEVSEQVLAKIHQTLS
jgi:phosphoesterase RecJ-like protein